MNIEQRALIARTIDNTTLTTRIADAYELAHRYAGLSQNLILSAINFADQLAGKGHHVLAADMRERTTKIVQAKVRK